MTLDSFCNSCDVFTVNFQNWDIAGFWKKCVFYTDGRKTTLQWPTVVCEVSLTDINFSNAAVPNPAAVEKVSTALAIPYLNSNLQALDGNVK